MTKKPIEKPAGLFNKDKGQQLYAHEPRSGSDRSERSDVCSPSKEVLSPDEPDHDPHDFVVRKEDKKKSEEVASLLVDKKDENKKPGVWSKIKSVFTPKKTSSPSSLGDDEDEENLHRPSRKRVETVEFSQLAGGDKGKDDLEL